MATAVQTGLEPPRSRPARVLDAVESVLAAERHQLPLWLPVALGAGIAAYFDLPYEAQWKAAVAIGLAVAAAGLASVGLLGRCLLSLGLVFVLGIALAWSRSESASGQVLRSELYSHRFEAVVLASEELAARGRYRLLLDPLDPALPDRVRVTFRIAPGADVLPGAKVAVRATLRPPAGPSVPGGYDFAFRAWFDGTGATGYGLGPVSVVRPAPPPSGLFARLTALRARLTRRISDGVGGESGTVAAALVTGERGKIPANVNQAMRDAGLAHLLSISGLHIAVVVGGTMWLLRRLLCLFPWIALRWRVKMIAAGFAALAGIGYTLLAGAEVPTVRSCIAALIVLAGLMLGRQAISLRMVAAAAALILIVRPEALLNPSFQLSFGAVSAIIALYESAWVRGLDRSEGAGLPGRVARAILLLLLSGLAAEFALMPIALHHFGRNGAYGVLANLVAIPLSSFVVMPALAAALLLDLIGLAAPAYAVLRVSLDALIALSFEVSSWPGAVLRLPLAGAGAFAAFVVGGLWLLLWRTRLRWLGVAPILAAWAAMLAAAPPDLLVSPDGRHLGLATDGRLALLRPRAGSFISDMWGDATASDEFVALAEQIGTCSRDVCTVRVRRGGRSWDLLATRSRDFVERPAMERSCGAADIVVSDRRLPYWCRPRWLKLDRAALARTGAVTIWLDPLRIRMAADDAGDHPWSRLGRDDQWYRRSSPASLPWMRTREGR